MSDNQKPTRPKRSTDIRVLKCPTCKATMRIIFACVGFETIRYCEECGTLIQQYHNSTEYLTLTHNRLK